MIFEKEECRADKNWAQLKKNKGVQQLKLIINVYTRRKSFSKKSIHFLKSINDLENQI